MTTKRKMRTYRVNYRRILRGKEIGSGRIRTEASSHKKADKKAAKLLADMTANSLDGSEYVSMPNGIEEEEEV